jgi:hypothetical protein
MKITTYVNSDQVVDEYQMSDAFPIIAGVLFETEIFLEPSLNYQSNPTLRIHTKNQHHLVAGSKLLLTLPTQDGEI